MEGGTVFHFVSGTPEQILARALETAGDLDVRIGGGPTTVREYLKRGLVDELHVAIAPIILGDGIRLWDELRGLEKDYDATAEAAESGTLHVLRLESFGAKRSVGALTPRAFTPTRAALAFLALAQNHSKPRRSSSSSLSE